MRSLTSEQDAKITAAANSDPDSPVLSETFFHRAKWAVDVRPDLAARKMRGRPKLEQTKVQVTLRLDAHVLETFKSEGRGWQSRINDVLSRAIKRRKGVA